MSHAAAPLPSPLTEDQGALLSRFATDADSTALLWASGYLAGLARALAPVAPAVAPADRQPSPAKTAPALSAASPSCSANQGRFLGHA